MYVRPRVDVKSPDADASSNGQQPFGTSLGVIWCLLRIRKKLR
jgi:hypothetical protein